MRWKKTKIRPHLRSSAVKEFQIRGWEPLIGGSLPRAAQGSLQIEIADQPVEVIGVHSQQARSFGVTPSRLLEGLHNELFLQFADGGVIAAPLPRIGGLAF